MEILADFARDNPVRKVGPDLYIFIHVLFYLRKIFIGNLLMTHVTVGIFIVVVRMAYFAEEDDDTKNVVLFGNVIPIQAVRIVEEDKKRVKDMSTNTALLDIQVEINSIYTTQERVI